MSDSAARVRTIDTIWKFENVVVNDTALIQSTKPCIVHEWLHVETDVKSGRPGYGFLTLWACVTPGVGKMQHTVLVRGTGHRLTGNDSSIRAVGRSIR